MSEQTNLDWIEQELNQTSTNANFESLPALKLQPNKIAEIEVDFSKPFPIWTDPVNKNVKAIIPVTFNGQKLSFWLNKRNPLFGQILTAYKDKKQVKFKVLQTGSQKDTRYNLVD